MKIVGLFAGIGGLELGLREAGHEAILLCENWAPAAEVLRVRFAAVANVGDIATLRVLPAQTELLTAGFPCQDLSQAGRTAGIEGRKSGLVDHVFRLLDRRRVAWVLLENVSFMLHLDAGRAMARLAAEFENRGYRWAYRVVNSLGFVPQRRERVLFLASRDADPADVLLVDDAKPDVAETDLDARAHGFYWTEGIRGLGWAADAIPTLKNGSTLGIASPPAILLPAGMIVTPDIRDAERLQGFPADWTAPAEAVRKASWRWSLVGNAVTVPVAAWIGRRLSHQGVYDSERDASLPKSGRWPRAARFDGSTRHCVDISDFPLWLARPSLVDFLQFAAEPLSARATAGFLERTGRSKLRFARGFTERVQAHLDCMRASDKVVEAVKRRVLAAAE